MVKTGDLTPCEFINVESEFAAMSVAIGASAAGARTYTATASQGLLYMAEALYNASGLGLPIVMTVANRAIGAPINIWNDHSDAMSQRDSGWIQLYAEANQEAVDLHVQAFRLAEELSLPVMVCMDGFVLTHAFERDRRADQEQVDAFLPPFEPRQVLDPDDPVTIGAMVGPEAFTEVRYLAHAKQLHALDVDPASSPPSSPRASAATPAAWCALPPRGRRDGRRRARLGARHDRGRRRRAARRRACGSASLGDQACFRPFPARRGPRGAARTPTGSSCSRRRFAVGRRRHRRRRTCGSHCAGLPARGPHGGRRARRPRRHQARRCARLLDDASPTGWTR